MNARQMESEAARAPPSEMLSDVAPAPPPSFDVGCSTKSDVSWPVNSTTVTMAPVCASPAKSAVTAAEPGDPDHVAENSVSRRVLAAAWMLTSVVQPDTVLGDALIVGWM